MFHLKCCRYFGPKKLSYGVINGINIVRIANAVKCHSLLPGHYELSDLVSDTKKHNSIRSTTFTG